MVYTIPNFTDTSQGIEGIMIAETTQLPGLVPGILFLIFAVILGAGYFAQERRTGAGNLPMWAAIAGLITTTGGFMLFLMDGLVGIETIIISLIITIVSAFAFLVMERD